MHGEDHQIDEIIFNRGEKLIKRYLNFDFDHEPFWYERTRENCIERKCVEEMSSDILNMLSLSFQIKDDKDIQIMKKFQDAFITQMSRDEDVGLQCEDDITAISEIENSGTAVLEDHICSSQEKERANRETKNMFRTLRYFYKTFNDIGANAGPILTEQIVLKGHEILMKNLTVNAGKLSENERETTCPIFNKRIVYPSPSFVEEVLPGFLDTANYMAVYLNHRRFRENYGPDFLKTVVKFCAWFFYNLISLHPFGDGNGRMARLLFCYLQYMITPFPVGIYNIFAKTRKRDYMKAISRTRERLISHLQQTNNKRGLKEGWSLECKPAELATMIIECQWYAWSQYKLEMENDSNDTYESKIKDSQSTPSL